MRRKSKSASSRYQGSLGLGEESLNKGRAAVAGKGRLFVIMSVFVLCYAVVGFRLISLVNMPNNFENKVAGIHDALFASRPDIIDRNGAILATDIQTFSLFANPRQMLDPEGVADHLLQLMPTLDEVVLHRDLSSGRAFVFIKRELAPVQKARIHALGIPGLGFLSENRRVYPAGSTASHILGVVGVDHDGLSGIEKHIDEQGGRALRSFGVSHKSKLVSVKLALDLRVQHSLRDELVLALNLYGAKAAAGIILDVRTGEILAMSSLPDFDPNNASQAFQSDRFNRISGGVFEMGSTFKIFTAAMAFDFGVADWESRYDAREPIRVSSFQITDFHPQRRILSFPEVFLHSSNIGAARMALEVGVERHRDFLSRLGLLDKLVTELPESEKPLIPRRWTDLSTMTISFGHGLSVTPLQMVSAVAALVNGGRLIPPTFLKRNSALSSGLGVQVVAPETSEMIRYLLRLNVREGTARKAEVSGYLVGGKTGSAEKNINAVYVEGKLRTSFIGVFPMDDPAYVILTMLDEPQALEETRGYITAGWNAAPLAGRIIRRVAPMLSLMPRDEPPESRVPESVVISF